VTLIAHRAFFAGSIFDSGCTALKGSASDPSKCARCRTCPQEGLWAHIQGYYNPQKGRVTLCAEKKMDAQQVEHWPVGRSDPNLEHGTMRVCVTNGPRNGLNIGRRVGLRPGSRRRWVFGLVCMPFLSSRASRKHVPSQVSGYDPTFLQYIPVLQGFCARITNFICKHPHWLDTPPPSCIVHTIAQYSVNARPPFFAIYTI